MKFIYFFLLLILNLGVSTANIFRPKGRFGILFAAFNKRPNTTKESPQILGFPANPSKEGVLNMENIKKPFLTGLFRSIKESPKLQEFILNVTDKLVSFGLSYFAIRLLSKTLSSTWNEIQSKFGGLKDAAEKASTNSTISRYLRVNTTLSTYEEDVLNGMVTPEQVQCSMDDIGGLDAIKELLFDLFQPPSDSGAEAHGSPLLTDAPTRSVLLYGPPGCGKSMLARSLCRQLRLPMLCVTPSLLLRMYVGETPRLTKALFTLAQKLQPCLVFIDEADSLFSARMTNDQGVDRKIITEFMQLWDDLLRERAEVIVLGATNRPQDLDPAVQRRFERALLVPSPDLNARRQVLTRILRHTRLDADFDAYKCAQATEGYTSSDLSSVCKAAVRLARKEQQPGGSIRPLRTEDILEALKSVYPTAWASGDYARQTDSASAYSHPYVDHSAQHTAAYPADGYYNEYEVDDEDQPHHQQPRHQQKQQGETGSMASTGWEKEDNEGIDEEGEDYDNED